MPAQVPAVVAQLAKVAAMPANTNTPNTPADWAQLVAQYNGTWAKASTPAARAKLRKDIGKVLRGHIYRATGNGSTRKGRYEPTTGAQVCVALGVLHAPTVTPAKAHATVASMRAKARKAAQGGARAAKRATPRVARPVPTDAQVAAVAAAHVAATGAPQAS